LRIVFIGQAPFGKDCLETLLNQGENVVGVLTSADKPGQKKPNPVKEFALKAGLPLLQPQRLKDPEAYEWVKGLRPDLLVLAYVTDIVPQSMIDLTTLGGINFHPSLLPKYRGASAMNWAIINGETKTGITIHKIDAGVDTGPIIIQEEVPISPNDTVKSLYFEKIYPLGVKMVAEAVRLIREGKAEPVPQDETQASFQPIIKETDVRIDWQRNSKDIYNLIRGSNPTPGAWTTLREEKLKVWEAKPYDAEGEPGTVLEILGEEGFVVAAGEGAVLVQRVQYGNLRDKIPAGQFVFSYNLKKGEQLGL